MLRCSVRDCEYELWAGGFCSLHYQRVRADVPFSRPLKNYKREAQVNRGRARELMLKYLAIRRCVDCGEDNFLVLEFDHLGEEEKEENISRMVQNGELWSDIEAEIAKCEVVCRNCHQIRTHRRNKSWRTMVTPEQLLRIRREYIEYRGV